MNKTKARATGEVRQSQLITTFGPGAMVDLPNHSVLIGGLDYWTGEKERIYEARFEAYLQHELKKPELRLYAPPIDSSDPTGPTTGISVFQFPTWFLGQVDETWRDADGRLYRTRPLVRHGDLVKGGYYDNERRVRPVVPVRFVQACVKGHISDIDWYEFVRQGSDKPETGILWLDEGGAGNDFAEIFVRCEKTGKRRPLSDASVPESRVLGRCSGRSPWLGPYVREDCDKHNRLLIRSASNAYFSQTVSAIAIPDGDKPIRDAVDKVFDPFLMSCDGPAEVKYERKKERVAAALEGFSNEAVWAEVERRQRGLPPPEKKGIKGPELDTLLTHDDPPDADRPDKDFFACVHPVGALPASAVGKLDRLLLVHRLREVVVQVGFRRFEASPPDMDGELDIGAELAPLSREQNWLPASQNRGEGLFISFSPAEINRWLQRDAVRARAVQLKAGFEIWKEQKNVATGFYGLPYIMLHSFAHLMITTLALDCGYSASSIRERIYAGENGYGVLLYTGTPGAEGTLGGLVDMGKNLGRHVQRALELGRLCSNDPVCAQHDPSDGLEGRYLHGAACHGCLLIAEPSCERRNELLDRALVVPTVASPDVAFFVGAG